MLRPIKAIKQNLILIRSLSTKRVTREMRNSSAVRSSSPNVPGLTDKCVKVPNTPVGPGAAKDKEYKNPEYFCYNIDSFGEAEVELAKYRLPAPSNKKPYPK
ncbi:uncharacterized protein LOC108630087 isoform X2 [Ceratina calcarata]|uniref:Uncharacterized protein LOC108629342 isoform X2 n=1 Tax=Ceratina calcarata TaxID=156304 RepID=A0AAJ7NCC3_9HYME|nr:uncharacterized protein LOC108629342 isoform X2 [Ceratina calcarata]XP_017888640.1 uncharacterized protein LOC108630087 isoform X2 [Ceratina calcarata]